jgi:hypothetical protein
MALADETACKRLFEYNRKQPVLTKHFLTVFIRCFDCGFYRFEVRHSAPKNRRQFFSSRAALILFLYSREM